MNGTPLPTGHEMPIRIPAPNAKPQSNGRGFKIAAYVIAVLVLAYIAFAVFAMVREDGFNGDTVFAILAGLLCALPAFAGLPWIIGQTRQIRAGQRLYLNGAHLTISEASGKHQVIDLTSARLRVELLGGPRDTNATRAMGEGKRIAVEGEVRKVNRPGPGRNIGREIAEYHVPFHPILIWTRESDDMQIPIGLCHADSGRMRDPGETMMIAEALRFHQDPAAQHVAGQLRTVARWPRLPSIADADIDAIPATPADYPVDAPVIPTPVRAGVPSPEIRLPGAGSTPGS